MGVLEQEIEAFYQEDLNQEMLKDNFKDYVNRISKYELLPVEEQRELIRRYKEENDKEAFEKMINHNLRLAIFIAKRFRDKCTSMTFFDLIQEANLSLVQAVNGYDLSRSDIKPSTYIAKTMSNNIIREINRTDSMIKKSPYMLEMTNRYKKFEQEYFSKNRCFPTKEEVIEELGIDEDQYVVLISIRDTTPVSLNQVVSDKDDDTTSELQDFIADKDDKFIKREDTIDTKLIVKTVKDILTPREFYLIYYRLIAEERKTLAQIGEHFGVSRERIRQIEAKALKKLKNIKKKELNTLKKYSIDELLQMDLRPLSAERIIIYNHLKKTLDPITYYFLYTKNEKEYIIKDYIGEFEDLTLNEIKDYIAKCERIEKEVFTKEYVEEVSTEDIKHLSISELLQLDIDPTIKKVHTQAKIKKLKHY